MARKSLVWNGRALTERMRAAQKAGVNATMAACTVHSKNNHNWHNRTGILEGSIGLAEYAREVPGGVEGSWGSQDVKYALIHELGGTILAKNAKALAIPQPDGGVVFVKSVTIPARPYLRPAADTHYPSLALNIRKAFERGGSGPSDNPARAST